MIVVREAVTSSDFDLVRALFQEYADSLEFELDFQDFEAELAGLPGAYEPPAGCVLLAIDSGECAGCVAMRPLADGVCEMKRLYLRDAFRGLGAGRVMAEAVVARAAAAGYSSMRLDTISTMLSANALYLSIGFREIPAYRHNPIEGARFFELSLLSE